MGCLKSIFLIISITIIIFSIYMYFALAHMENMTPSDKASAERKDCQHAAHALIKKSIKSNLKDPSSYKEVSHKYYTNAIEIKYTATNGFGGRVTDAYRYHFEPDVCGTNSKVEKIN